MKILIFADSRGQHRASGSTHLMFAERLSKHHSLTVDSYLCPFKWTTTIDFLETFPPSMLVKYDWIILYTGIVDWSPRKRSSAINDLYDNKFESNLGSLRLNTNDYQKKIVNNKKKKFDEIFGENAMSLHMSRQFSTHYEEEPTLNMYSLEMAKTSLIPKLREINNLIYINSNRFVPGWRGDYKRDRPENIDITHQYSDIFSDALSNNLIDLRVWESTDIKKMTCDNLHLTAAGNDFIYKKICGIVGIQDQANLNTEKSTFIMKKDQALTMGDCLALLRAANNALRIGDYETAFRKALAGFQESRRASYFHTALLAARRIGKPEATERLFDLAQSIAPMAIEEVSIDYNYLKRFAYLLPQNIKDRVIELAKRPTLSSTELTQLESKLAQTDQLINFISGREAIVEARFRDEFWYLKDYALSFPYNYINDYSKNLPLYPSSRSKIPKSISLIYPIKNRNTRVKLSLRSLAEAAIDFSSTSKFPSLNIDILIIEDEGDEGLELGDFSGLPFDVTHIRVNTGVSWTRSGLLNVGIKEAKGELVCFVDADVLFPKKFLSRISKAIESADALTTLFAINMFETHSHLKEGRRHAPGAPYSYMWAVLKKHANAVNGFSEAYVGWGSEDRDFEYRICTKQELRVVATTGLEGNPYVFHFSHDVRTGIESRSQNQEQLAIIRKTSSTDTLIADPKLNIRRILKNKYRYRENIGDIRASLSKDYACRKDKTLIIMGNGPSLGEIMNDSGLLSLVKTFDTFGLNAAYRAYDKYNFYPTYFGSFDNRVCDSHADNFMKLVNGNNPIQRFFFAKQSVFDQVTKSNKRFQLINFKAAPKGVSRQQQMSVDFNDFNDCGSSGTNAVQAGYIMGYRHFILLGVDCNYVEMLEGVKDLDGIKYEVVCEIKNNPNYWFDGYQVKGDQFHKPNEKDIQLVSWAKLDQLLATGDGYISNCSMVSKLPMYDILPFWQRCQKYRNIFLVISCKKYSGRIELLKPRYDSGVKQDDLVLYVVGESERNILTDYSVLNLNVGDAYEHLPQKVQAAIRFCVENLEFERIVKVDDDVFVNFDNFYEVVNNSFNYDYMGRRTPTRAGIKPSSNWHFGKVDVGSLHEGIPFEVEGPPEYWAGGGMYVISKRAATYLATSFASQLSCYHLYEDFMVGDLLSRQGISVVPWEELIYPHLSGWCVTNLKELMSDELVHVRDVDRAKQSVSIHCGSYPPYYTVSEKMLATIYSELARASS